MLSKVSWMDSGGHQSWSAQLLILCKDSVEHLQRRQRRSRYATDSPGCVCHLSVRRHKALPWSWGRVLRGEHGRVGGPQQLVLQGSTYVTSSWQSPRRSWLLKTHSSFRRSPPWFWVPVSSRKHTWRDTCFQDRIYKVVLIIVTSVLTIAC